MNVWNCVRRWWKPAQWADDRPLSAEERELITFQDEAAKYGGYTIGGAPRDIDPTDELKEPR